MLSRQQLVVVMVLQLLLVVRLVLLAAQVAMPLLQRRSLVLALTSK